MATQYWVGDFFVDLTRNQITQQQQSHKVPPKALAVLTYLAKNANRVISHEELLSQVWPDTVVTPNTMQRSIAQLRKALGEDGLIKTHAKQGYSLECDVRWQSKMDVEVPVEQAPLEKADKPIKTDTDTAKPKSAKSLIIALVGIVILAVIAFSYLTPTPPLKLSIAKMRLLTATDNKEYGGNYTPDGQYVVFNRYAEKLCINNLWAKNLKTQQEIQLTKDWGTYGSHSFSKDTKELVFIESENCNKPVSQNQCYKLMRLDFEKALETSQSPSVLMECKNSRIAKPVWINNNNIVLLQQLANRWKLTSYSIADNKSTVIYQLEDGNLLDFDYSAKDNLISLISAHNDGLHYIEILKPDGQLLSSHPIEYPKEIANLRIIQPNFMPGAEQLVFSTGRQLFTLSYEGKITNISLPLAEAMGSPIFHPDGKRMLVIKGHYDGDIVTMPLSQLAQIKTEQNNNYSTLERSTQNEDTALFQPNGELIAFSSRRSGEDQLWITDDSGAQQLSDFPIDTIIYGMDWATDGKSILMSANKELTRILLDGTHSPIPFAHPVVQLFQFNSENNSALLMARIKGVLKFVELNLNDATFRVITDKKVSWALKTEDGRLVYTDHMERFWQPGPAEDQLIESLDGQGSDKRFVTKHNMIYGINEQFQLWSYDLDGDAFEILGHMPLNTDYLTGINQTDILLSIRVTAKKEVAELILAD